jgi:AcrR family transcriptional regulator
MATCKRFERSTWRSRSQCVIAHAMARTQSPDYEKRRDAILVKAANLFAKKGFLGTSISELASAGKQSKSLFYHYFASKEDVLYELMSSHLDELLAIAKCIETRSDLVASARLYALTAEFMAAYVDAANAQRVLLNELDNLPPARRQDIVERQRKIIAIVRRLMLEITPSLADHPEKQMPAAMLYFGMINWAHNWFDPNGPLPAEGLARMAVDFTLNGLRAQA